MEAFVQTGNLGLTTVPIRSHGYNSPLITISFDVTMDDTEWAVYDGEQMLAGPYSIGDHIAQEIREKFRELGLIPAPPARREEPLPEVPAKREPKKITLETCTENLLGLQKRTAKNFVEMGKWLTEAKRLIGHGNWLAYLEGVGFKEWQAQTLMGVFREWGSNPQLIEDLKWTQLVEVLRAPQEIRTHLVEFAPGHTVKEIHLEARTLRQEPAESPPVPAQPTPPEAPEPTPELSADPEPTPEPVAPPEPPQAAQEVPEPPTTPAEEPATLPFPVAALSDHEEPVPAPKAVTPPPPPDPYRAQKEEALRVNMAMRRILDVATKERAKVTGVTGRGIGDWIDLEIVYALHDTAKGLLADLDAIALDCKRG